jgi:hypothetical protein
VFANRFGLHCESVTLDIVHCVRYLLYASLDLTVFPFSVIIFHFNNFFILVATVIFECLVFNGCFFIESVLGKRYSFVSRMKFGNVTHICFHQD